MMETQTVLKQILKKGFISDELELERALILDRKLRLLILEQPELAESRKKFRALIKEYEKNNWGSDSVIDEEKIIGSDLAESIAEQEREFFMRRKDIIKKKIAEYGLNQQDLVILLAHSKSYISELMNGISPFNNKDLIIIHQLFDIKLDDLIPTIISHKESVRIKASILKINKPNLKFERKL